jgi:hypothetical protein
MEKETNLTPEVPPKSERVIVKAQNSLPYRLLTGDAHGFGVSFGNMAPGLGFAIGHNLHKADRREQHRSSDRRALPFTGNLADAGARSFE